MRGCCAVQLAVVIMLTPAPTRGQQPATVTVAAGSRYGASWPHQFLFGRHYRDLWTIPIRVEVLDLSRYAGGLTPLKRGGGRQTKTLRFQSGDGRVFAFRSVDKDPTAAIPPQLRQTFVNQIVQDQISSSHPAGALVVSALLDAAGVLHTEPRLFVLPDDARLGAFRTDFAGMLGQLEERPKEGSDDEPGFAGADGIASTQKLWEHLGHSSRHRVDSRAFLTARLLDIYVGDWYRHADQWRWARFEEGDGHVWRPIPRDRDQAFSKLDGFLPWLARFYQPDVVGFGDGYPDMVGLTWDARVLDRRLLVDLEKPVWDSIAAALQGWLSDSVIAAAVHRIPPEYYARDGARLTRALKLRRDGLRLAADRFYALLASSVDIHGTDEAELAVVDRQGDGSVSVRLYRRDRGSSAASGGEGGPAYYSRTFRPGETREVRLYMHGGDNRVVVRGAGPGDIAVRAIGGPGDDELVDSARAGGARFYDDHGNNRFLTGPGTAVDRHPYAEPSFSDPTQAPPRDWGSRWNPTVRLLYLPKLGVVAGAGQTYTKYGFRKEPYSTLMTLGVNYATSEQRFQAEYLGEFRGVGRSLRATLEARASGIDVVSFYGFGNNVAAPGASEYYDVRQQHYLFAPSIVVPISEAVQFSFGPLLKYGQTTPQAGTLIDSLRPYGVNGFGQMGGQVEFSVDTRNRPRAPSRGVSLSVGGSVYPAAWDVTSAFGEGHAEAATYLTASIPLQPTLATRIGGKKVWGTYPFHEAAYVGGLSSVRGFPEYRFGGDAALYGNAELRLLLTKFYFLMPVDLGVFGLADAGRVFVAGETSDRWHTATGGGVWLAFLSRGNTLSVATARSAEATLTYVRAGFAF